MSELTYFEKRRIQMEYAVPLVNDLKAVLGEEKLLEALEEVNRLRLQRAEQRASIDFSEMDGLVDIYAEGGSLEYEVIASSADQYDIDMHRCRYAEMMEELGGRDFGHLLICNADFVAAKEMGMELSRTKTLMQGGGKCDFRYRQTKS